MKRTHWLLAILTTAMLLLAACGGGGGNEGAGDNGGGAANGNAITIKATDFKFEPSDFTFEQGQTYSITLVNDGPSVHDITIDELGFTSGSVNPGDSVTVELTPDQAGSFEAYCAVPSHRELGMVATVEVQ